jgi:hypothetical protein
MDNKRIIQKKIKRKSWFSGNTNKIDKSLANLAKRKREYPK